jgi:hypothetical protein
MSCSTNSQSPPGLVICAAFIFLPIKNLLLSIDECCQVQPFAPENNECLSRADAFER